MKRDEKSGLDTVDNLVLKQEGESALFVEFWENLLFIAGKSDFVIVICRVAGQRI